MNQREKYLAIGTVAAVGLFAFVSLGGGDAIDSVLSGNSSASREEKEFHENIDALKDIFDVYARYRGVTEERKDESGRRIRADLAFQGRVAELCRRNGFPQPQISTDVQEIEKVDDYELINTAIRLEGSWTDIVKLVKVFEREGLIFREMELKSTRDREGMTARITVASIAERIRRSRKTTR